MRSRLTELIKLFIFGVIIGGVCTCILYFIFPQFLCYTVYVVTGSNLSGIENREVNPGTCLVEEFTPQYNFLTGIIISVRREDSNDIIVGKLYNDRQRLLAKDQFTLRDTSYEFGFYQWVTPGEKYRLEITFPEKNNNAVVTTFGSEDIGTLEHISFYIDGIQRQDAFYIQYVYGAYSRKLLAFWFLVFFLGGLSIWDTARFLLGRRRKNVDVAIPDRKK